MRLVADEGVEAAIVGHLREEGHDVWYVAEMSPGMTDEAVLALAADEDALLLTNDKDFGALVFQQRRLSTGIILLRLAGLTAAGKSQLVGNVIATHGDQLEASFTVVTRGRVRIRPAR